MNSIVRLYVPDKIMNYTDKTHLYKEYKETPVNMTISRHLQLIGGVLEDFIKMRSMEGKDTLDFLTKPSKENFLHSMDDKEWINVGKKTTTSYFTYFADPDKTILVIDFEPSNGIVDWKINFKFFAGIPRKAYKKCKDIWFAHGGYIQGYHAIDDDVKQLIKENVSTIQHIVIRGFSQGAAYTILCLEDVEFLKEKYGYTYETHAIAYECPRVILFLFSWNVKRRLKNVTIIRNMGDVVTHAPFIIFGFKHIGGVFIKIGKWYRDLFPLHFMHYVNKVYASLPSYEEVKAK